MRREEFPNLVFNACQAVREQYGILIEPGKFVRRGPTTRVEAVCPLTAVVIYKTQDVANAVAGSATGKVADITGLDEMYLAGFWRGYDGAARGQEKYTLTNSRSIEYNEGQKDGWQFYVDQEAREAVDGPE